ncbi:unnamed protein product [Closterium sp. Yama58-4]|nr:unnamed protein product [Closterium sp. Yama58-4]
MRDEGINFIPSHPHRRPTNFLHLIPPHSHRCPPFFLSHPSSLPSMYSFLPLSHPSTPISVLPSPSLPTLFIPIFHPLIPPLPSLSSLLPHSQPSSFPSSSLSSLHSCLCPPFSLPPSQPSSFPSSTLSSIHSHLCPPFSLTPNPLHSHLPHSHPSTPASVLPSPPLPTLFIPIFHPLIPPLPSLSSLLPHSQPSSFPSSSLSSLHSCLCPPFSLPSNPLHSHFPPSHPSTPISVLPFPSLPTLFIPIFHPIIHPLPSLSSLLPHSQPSSFPSSTLSSLQSHLCPLFSLTPNPLHSHLPPSHPSTPVSVLPSPSLPTLFIPIFHPLIPPLPSLSSLLPRSQPSSFPSSTLSSLHSHLCPPFSLTPNPLHSHLPHSHPSTPISLIPSRFHPCLAVDVFGEFQASEFNIGKVHGLVHLVDDIRRSGVPVHYNANMFEFLHQPLVKRAYRASNKRDAMPQIVKHSVMARMLQALDDSDHNKEDSHHRMVALQKAMETGRNTLVATSHKVNWRDSRFVGGDLWREYETAAPGDMLQLRALLSQRQADGVELSDEIQVRKGMAIPECYIV